MDNMSPSFDLASLLHVVDLAASATARAERLRSAGGGDDRRWVDLSQYLRAPFHGRLFAGLAHPDDWADFQSDSPRVACALADVESAARLAIQAVSDRNAGAWAWVDALAGATRALRAAVEVDDDATAGPDSASESLTVELRRRDHAKTAALVEFMFGRTTASLAEVGEALYEDAAVNVKTIRALTSRTTKVAEAMGSPLRYRTTGEHVIKDG